MSTVGTTSHDGSVVHLHVVDLQILHAQSLRLSVSLQVLQENQEELASRLRPSALASSSLDHVSLSVTTDISVVSAESNNVLVGNDVIQVSLGLDQRHSLDGSTDLMSVLEVNGQVRTTGVAAYNDYAD